MNFRLPGPAPMELIIGFVRAVKAEAKSLARSIRMRHRARTKINFLISEQRTLRLDIGSGNHVREGWIGIDLNPSATIEWDLSWGIPFPDGSIDEIHSEHCFEHFDRRSLDVLLRECFRVLKDSGTISFSVPNMRPYFTAYVEKRRDWLSTKVFDRPFLPTETLIDIVDWIALCGNQHRILFDDESAVQRLIDVGFKEAQLRDFDPKTDYSLRESSLYVKAVKQGAP